MLDFILSHADPGIRHPADQFIVFFIMLLHPQRYGYRSVAGEFNRVSQQIYQNLLDPHLITVLFIRNVRIKIQHQLYRFVMDLDLDQGGYIIDQR